jgi:Flp pilus assembly protein TadG
MGRQRVGSVRHPSIRNPRSRGQSLVEFALVLPIFFLMLFGLIDMGRYVYLNSTLSQAAREAARVAAVEASWIGSTDPSCGTAGGPVCPANQAALRADMLAGANRMMAPFGSIALTDLYTSCGTTAPAPVVSQTCADGAINRYASVRVVMVFRPITPVVSSMYASITTQASATMVIN